MRKHLYLLLGLLSGYIELGGILYALSLQYPPIKAIGIVLAFQIGNLVPVPIRLNKISTYSALTISAFCFLYLQFYSSEYWVLLFGMAFLSAAILSMRSNYAEKTGTTSKRISRVSGFIIAPLFSIPLVLLALALLYVFILILSGKNTKIAIIKPKLNFYNVIMIIHQMHYFCYTYFIIIIIHNIMRFSPFSICIFFALGWITYISIGYFLNKTNYKAYFIIGHSFLFIVLGLMYFNFSNYLTIVLWICTGFGAGTIFALNELNKSLLPYNKDAMDYSENIGHILGIILSLALYSISKNIYLPLAGASVLAILAAISFYLKTRIPSYRMLNTDLNRK